MNFSKTLFAAALIVFLSSNANAKLIEPESLILKIIDEQSKIYQLQLEVDVAVFDPEAIILLEENALIFSSASSMEKI